MRIKEIIVHRICRLFEVKSIVTISMTAAMLYLVTHPNAVSGEVLALFSSVYGAIITYFFTRKEEKDA